MDSIPQRLCKKCNTSYPFTPEFWHKDKKGSGGLSSTCKECKKAKSRQWHAENSDYVAERHHDWYLNNIDHVRDYRSDNAEKITEQKREWRQNNPDLVAAQKKRHYERHKAKIAAYQKGWQERTRKQRTAYNKKYYLQNARLICKRSSDWVKANPERALNNFHARRARIAGNGGEGFTKADKALQLRSQKGLCWWCGKEMGKDVTIDHIVAINKGGPHSPRNIVLAHKSCNCSKQDKLPQDWIGRLF